MSQYNSSIFIPYLYSILGPLIEVCTVIYFWYRTSNLVLLQAMLYAKQVDAVLLLKPGAMHVVYTKIIIL